MVCQAGKQKRSDDVEVTNSSRDYYPGLVPYPSQMGKNREIMLLGSEGKARTEFQK